MEIVCIVFSQTAPKTGMYTLSFVCTARPTPMHQKNLAVCHRIKFVTSQHRLGRINRSVCIQFRAGRNLFSLSTSAKRSVLARCTEGDSRSKLPCCHRTCAAHRHRTVRESLYKCSLDYCRFWSAKCTSDLADLGGASLMHRIHFCVEGPMKKQKIPWLVSVKSSRFYHHTSLQQKQPNGRATKVDWNLSIVPCQALLSSHLYSHLQTSLPLLLSISKAICSASSLIFNYTQSFLFPRT
jgi:hypothetical protein